MTDTRSTNAAGCGPENPSSPCAPTDSVLSDSSSGAALLGLGRSGWQPIETAPKDGTSVILLYEAEVW